MRSKRRRKRIPMYTAGCPSSTWLPFTEHGNSSWKKVYPKAKYFIPSDADLWDRVWDMHVAGNATTLFVAAHTVNYHGNAQKLASRAYMLRPRENVPWRLLGARLESIPEDTPVVEPEPAPLVESISLFLCLSSSPVASVPASLALSLPKILRIFCWVWNLALALYPDSYLDSS